MPQHEQEHRMRAEQHGRCGDASAVQPCRTGAQPHQSQHQQRAIQFQMQRPERRVERLLHQRQPLCQRREQCRLPVAEQQTVQADLACQMRKRRRTTGVHREPRRPGQRGGPQMRIRPGCQQQRGDNGRRGHRDTQPHHSLGHLRDEWTRTREGRRQHRAADQKEHIDCGVAVEQHSQRRPRVLCGFRHEAADEVQQHHLHRRYAAKPLQILHLAWLHHPCLSRRRRSEVREPARRAALGDSWPETARRALPRRRHWR